MSTPDSAAAAVTIEAASQRLAEIEGYAGRRWVAVYVARALPPGVAHPESVRTLERQAEAAADEVLQARRDVARAVQAMRPQEPAVAP